jgi:hemin uptake protein HemP
MKSIPQLRVPKPQSPGVSARPVQHRVSDTTLHANRDSMSASASPVWDTPTLMRGGREALILFEGRQYRLRITSNNKLIMTA